MSRKITNPNAKHHVVLISDGVTYELENHIIVIVRVYHQHHNGTFLDNSNSGMSSYKLLSLLKATKVRAPLGAINAVHSYHDNLD